MGVAAIGGYENANGRAMDLWEAVYLNDLLVVLTDTFSTQAFYQVQSIAILTMYFIRDSACPDRTSSKIQREQKGGPG